MKEYVQTSLVRKELVCDTKKREMSVKDLVNIIWLCLLVFATVAYWFYNPSLLSELVDIIGNAVSGGLVLFSDLTANFVLLLISLLALRFFMFLIAEVVKKQMPKAIGNLARWNVEFSFYINSVRTDHAMFRRRISVDVCWVGCA